MHMFFSQPTKMHLNRFHVCDGWFVAILASDQQTLDILERMSMDSKSYLAIDSDLKEIY